MLSDEEQDQEEQDEDETVPRALTLLDRLNKRGGRRKPPPLRSTIPIASITPPGHGPWWVFMMVNVAGEGKVQFVLPFVCGRLGELDSPLSSHLSLSLSLS